MSKVSVLWIYLKNKKINRRTSKIRLYQGLMKERRRYALDDVTVQDSKCQCLTFLSDCRALSLRVSSITAPSLPESSCTGKVVYRRHAVLYSNTLGKQKHIISKQPQCGPHWLFTRLMNVNASRHVLLYSIEVIRERPLPANL